MSQLIPSALNQVPEDDMWGIVVYFYVTPQGTLVHKFCGSYLEFDEANCGFKEHDDSPFTFADLEAELESLEENQAFKRYFSVNIGKHVEYGTDCARIGRKMA